MVWPKLLEIMPHKTLFMKQKQQTGRMRCKNYCFSVGGTNGPAAILCFLGYLFKQSSVVLENNTALYGGKIK